MIVATLIMSIAVVGMISGLSGATRNAALLRDYDRVTQLARLRMNDLVVDPDFHAGSTIHGDFDRSLAGGLTAGWQASVSTFELAPPANRPYIGEMVLERVVLDTWWMSGRTRRTFRLETLRRRILTQADLAAVGQ